MALKMYSFLFGRISIIGPLINDKNQFYRELFLKKIYISDKFNKYAFLKVQEIVYNDETYFVGYLVKYKAKDEEIVLEESLIFGTSTIDSAVIAKPEFVLHPFSGVLAYRPLPGKFSARQFRTKFSRLVESSKDFFFINVKIESVNEDQQIEEQFKRFQRINCINIHLHPSNPNNRDIWKKMDEKIQGLGASEYQQKVIGGSNGLNIEKVMQDDLYNGILMASDGYGFASIDGILDDNRHTTITTADNPTEIKSPIDDIPEHLINNLLPVFNEIQNRTTNEDKNKD